MAPELHDPLAAELWAARREARPIGAVGAIDAARGKRIADELYGALRAGGAAQVGWKLGFTDAAAQAKFRTDRPFWAPVFDSSVLPGPDLRRSALVAPLLEAEIAVVTDRQGTRVAACIEIADCRFPGWRVSRGEALADFGLQGAMRFGEPRAGVPDVHVVVRRNDEIVAEGSRPVSAALELLGWLDAAARTSLVATGSIIAPIPLTPGRWSADFGPLGQLDLEVAP